jgi:choline transport protein
MSLSSGGQYHWVSQFAPASLQKPLSFATGWASTLGWISGVPSCAVQLAGIIQQLVATGSPNTGFSEQWQVTLLMFAFTFLIVAFNIYGAHHLPLAEGIILFAHVFGFFVFLVVLWVMADHAPASQVFTEFYNGGGWPSTGLSCLIGLTSPIWCFIGPDAGAHMSEELKDASIQLPRAMMWSIFLNGVLGVTMVISFCFCIKDVEAFVSGVIDTNLICRNYKRVLTKSQSSSYPIVDVVYTTTGSYAGTCVLIVFLLILLFFSAVSTVASSSRQIWSFARDHVSLVQPHSLSMKHLLKTLQGFPYSEWIRQVAPGSEVPVNSLLVCLAISLILAAINFGSNTALSAILSVSNAALLLSYIMSIGSLRLRRLQSEPLPPRRWSLGKFGGIINDITLAFLVVAFFFSFWPSYVLVGDSTAAADFNWTVVVLVIVGVLAVAYWTAGGRYKYVAPVTLIKVE